MRSVESLEGRQMFAIQPLAEWRFDDQPGSTTIQDSSENGRTLTLSGMATTDWVGPVTEAYSNSSALHFGTDAKSGSATLPGSTVDSISVWIKPDQSVTTNAGTAVVSEFGGGAKIGLGPWSSSLNGETISLINSAGRITSIANTQLTAGKWSHLAFVWSAVDSRYDAYLNGQEMSVITNSNGHVARISSTSILVGQRSYPTDRLPFAGAIDEFRLYTGSLSSSEVQSLATPFDAKPLLDSATWSGNETYSTQGANGFKTSDEFVPVDINNPSYTLAGWARSGTDAGASFVSNNLQYFGFASYDVDQQLIESRHVNIFPASKTYLVADLKPNDTMIYLNSAAGWNNGSDGFQKVLAWYGYTDSTGHTYPDYTYTRNVKDQTSSGLWPAGGVNTTTNTITLNQPWSGPEIKSGSAVANHFYGSSYNYLFYGAVPNSWTQYQGTIAGVAVNGDVSANKFRQGTAYIKPMLLTNYNGQSGNLIRWRDVEWNYGQSIGFHSADTVELHINNLVSFSSSATYQWTQLSGPTLTITNATLPTAKITTPRKLESYDLAFQLTVTDGSRTFSDTVSVEVPAASLLANWKFDDAAGSSSIVDSSGNARSLTLAGMVNSDWVTPVTANSANLSALHFGTDAKSGSATLPGSAVDSISVWVKPDQNVTTSAGTSVIAEFGGGAKIGLGPWTGSVTGETISLLDSSGKYTSIANVQLDAGTWSHLAFVWSAADARYDLFLNGREMPVVTNANGHVGRISTTSILVGQRSYAADRLPFAGALDEFRLYNGSLNAQEIQSLATPFEAKALIDAATWGGSETYSTHTANGSQFADELVPVDVSRAYTFLGRARSGTDNGENYSSTNLQSFGFTSYDIDQKPIEGRHVNVIPASQTRLASMLRPGDTVIRLEDASGWYNGSDALQKVFAWYGYMDRGGHTYPDYTYTRNVKDDASGGLWAAGAVNTANNTITLNKPWSGPYVPAGAAVANHVSSADDNYLFSGAVPNSWTQYQWTIDGVATNGDTSATKFRPGTAYIRPILVTNAHGQANNLIQWQGVEWTHSRPWQNPVNPFDVNASGSVTSQDILVLSNRLNSVGPGPLGTPTTGNAPPPYYDVNGDGALTEADLTLVQNAVAGSIVSIPRRFMADDRVELHSNLSRILDQATYSWEQLSGPPVALSNSNSFAASFTAPRMQTEGTLQFQLTVSDGLTTLTDVVTIVTEPTPIDARYRLETVDLAGNPIDTVEVGEQFRLKVYIEDVRAQVQGPFAGNLDITYDPQVIDLVSGPTFGELLNLFPLGSVAVPGIIDEVGASARSLTPIGSGEKLLFDVLLVGSSPGTVLLQGDPAERPVNSATNLYGVDTAIPINRIEYGAVRLEVTPIGAGGSLAGSNPENGEESEILGPESALPGSDGEVEHSSESSLDDPELNFCDATVSFQNVPATIRNGEATFEVTVSWTSEDCGDYSDILVTQLNIGDDSYTIELNPIESDPPDQSYTLPTEFRLSNGDKRSFTIQVTDDVDSVSEEIRLSANSQNHGTNALSGTILVSDEDSAEYWHIGTLSSNGTPDNDCSCTCIVCADTGVAVDPASGSWTYTLPGSSSWMPKFQSPGPANQSPYFRADLQFPEGKTVPQKVEASLYMMLPNNTRGSQIARPFTYAVDSVNSGSGDSYFAAGDRFQFAIQADLAAQVAAWGNVNVELEVIPEYDPSVPASSRVANGWLAAGSQLVRNLEDSPIAPGWTFPFLKQLVVGQKSRDINGAEHDGVAVFRGDNTASWYAKKSNGTFELPPESLSELVKELDGSYTLIDRFGNKDLFTSTGEHSKHVDRNGNETVFTRESDGKLSIVDPYNRTTIIAFPSTGIMTVTDFAQRVTAFNYSSGSETLNVTYPDADGAGSDPARETDFTYAGSLITQIASSGQTTTIEYDPLTNRVSTVTRPDNSTFEIITLGQAEGLPTSSELIEENAPGGLRSDFQNITTVRDGNGYQTTYKFDSHGRVLEITDALGRKQTIDRNERGQVTKITLPDPDDFSNLLGGIDGPLSESVTEFTYDASGNLIAKTLPILSGSSSSVFKQSWNEYSDLFGVPKEFIDELGVITRYEIGAGGNVDSLEVVAPNAILTQLRTGAAWQNLTSPLDVNQDGFVSPNDALVVINELNANGASLLPTHWDGTKPFYDVNGDKNVTPQDALVTINYLNEPGQVGPGNTTNLKTDYDYTEHGPVGGPNYVVGLLKQETTHTDRPTGNLRTQYDYYPLALNPGDSSQLWKIKTLDDQGNILSTVEYKYDSQGNVNEIIDERGASTRFKYDLLDRLVAVLGPDSDGTAEDEYAPLIRYDYDAFGNLIAQEVLNYNPIKSETTAHLTCYAYDKMNRLTHVGEAASAVIVEDSEENPIPPATQFDQLFNSQNATPANRSCTWLATVDSWGSHPVTVNGYDFNGNLISVDDAEGRTTRYHYDAVNQLVKIVEPAPGVSHESIPGEQLNSNSDHGDVDGAVTTFAYDNVGNLWSTTDALGNQTDYRYDDWNRLTSVVVAAVPDPANPTVLVHPTTTYSYSPIQATSAGAYGWRVSTNDPHGNMTQVQYDFLGQMQFVAESAVNGQSPVTSFEYYRDGALKAVIDPRSSRTDYSYDNQGRLSLVQEPIPGTSQHGRPETHFTYQVDGQIDTVTDPLGRVTTYDYDQAGRLSKVTSPDPDGTGSALPASMSYTYDSLGNVLKQTDALGHSTQFAYDELYRRTATTDALGKATAFAYDKVGNLISLTDPNSNVTTWAYDALDRVSTETQGTFGSRTYKYDAIGNLREKTDRNGRVTRYEYDDLYRLTNEKWYADAADLTADRTLAFTYDLVGQMQSGSDPAATLSFTYDSLGRTDLIQQSITGLSSPVVFDNDYDLNGNRTKLSANIGGTISNGAVSGGTKDFVTDFVFDKLNRMTQVTQQGWGGNAVATKRVDFVYDAASQMKSLARYQDLAGSFHVASSVLTYDQAGRLTDMVHQRVPVAGTPTSSDIIADYTWQWDSANRLTKHIDGKHTDESVDYEYDARDQLITADRSGDPTHEGYTYDDNGNRMSVTIDVSTVSYTTGSHNRLLSDGEFTYEYDNEGNRTKRTKISDGSYTDYTWDHHNRLTSVVDKTSGGAITMQASYEYDVFGRRVSKTVDPDGPGGSAPTSQDIFVYDGDQIALQYYDENISDATPPVLSNRYLYGNVVDLVLGDEQVTSTITPGNVLWPLGDHLATIRDVVDSNKVLREHISYDAFGKETAEEDFSSSGISISSDNPEAIDAYFRYVGRELDRETGFNQNRARPYDSSVARFVSEDPIGFDGLDANLNRYVGNHATYSRDPSGLAEGPIEIYTDENGVLRGRRRFPVTSLRRDGNGGLTDDPTKTPFTRRDSKHVAEQVGGFIGRTVDIASTVTPVVSDLRDVSECWYGRDALTREPLSIWQRIVTGGMIMVPVVGAAMFRKIGGTAADLHKLTNGAESAAEIAQTGLPSGLRTAQEAGISLSQAQRIQNAATRTNQRITVVGSRARGEADALSDWDYIVSGASRQRGTAKRSVPRGNAGGEISPSGRETGIDWWQDYNPNAPNYNPVDPNRPHVIFEPGRQP